MTVCLQADQESNITFSFYLPSFHSAVLYSQPHMQLPQAAEAVRSASAQNTSAGSFQTVFDPEVARAALGLETNPCEIKALKLSQATGSIGLDRCARCEMCVR
jgi:hypothetical protein